VVDDGAVELEGARHVGLASKNLDEALGAIHPAVILACQNHFDNPTFGLCRLTIDS
jgi:hypothetical protein